MSEHECWPPSDAKAGDTWRCPECGRRYEAQDSDLDGDIDWAEIGRG